MDANELAEIRERLGHLARREREFEDALADTTDILGDNHLYACTLRRTDARGDFRRHAPADIAALLAEVERLRAALTITPEKVAAAARAGYTEWDENTFDWLTKDWQEDWRAVGLAALRAAGMVEADNGKAL